MTPLPLTQRPGGRRDVYRLLSDHWHEIVGNRDHKLGSGAKVSRAGADVVGANTVPAAAEGDSPILRVLINEVPGMLKRWRKEARDV